jgi:hypothetical protein
VRVRVDDAGEDVQTTRLDLVERFALPRLDDGVEEAASDQNVSLADAFLGDNASAADREICGRD